VAVPADGRVPEDRSFHLKGTFCPSALLRTVSLPNGQGLCGVNLPSAGTAESGGILFEIGLERKNPTSAVAPNPGPMAQDLNFSRHSGEGRNPE